MDRRHGPLRNHRSLVDDWSSLAGSLTIGDIGSRRTRASAWPTMPQPLNLGAMASYANTSSMRTKQRRGQGRHYGTDYTYHVATGDAGSGGDVVTFHFRQFSEDSGLSSGGSSASSVADEYEAPGHLLSKTPAWLERPTKWNRSSGCAQSGTVASVLAAGVSDSEETDHGESDDDSDSIFMERMKCNRFYNPLRTTSSWPSVPSAVSKPLLPSRILGNHALKEKVELDHCGRDILDLGANLVTQFPLRATELPEKNLTLFLQNRSQYHRLGKFGTVEKLYFADCKKKCGFSFPIPPGQKF